jgi:hypothetical protein
VLIVGCTSWSREGADPKSLWVIEASANIKIGGQAMKCCPLSPLWTLGSSFYSRKEGAQEYKGCRSVERGWTRAPVAVWLSGWPLSWLLPLIRRRMSGSCISYFDQGESRGQGQGLGCVLEPILWTRCLSHSGWNSNQYGEKCMVIRPMCHAELYKADLTPALWFL